MIVAQTMLYGKPGLEAFERLPSAQALALAQRMDWQPLRDTAFPRAFDGKIACRTKNGRDLEVSVSDAYGNASRPASTQDCAAKFNANARRLLAEEQARELEDCLDAIESNDMFQLRLVRSCPDAVPG